MSTSKIQQLESQLASTADTQQKIGLINALAWELQDSDCTRAIALGEEAYALSTQGEFELSPYQKGQAESLLAQGSSHARLGNPEVAFTMLSAALQTFEALDATQQTARTLNALGDVQRVWGRFSDALEAYLQALALFEALDDQKGQATTLTNIGSTYLETGDLPKTQTYLLRGLTIFQEIGDARGQADALDSLCAVHYRLGDLEKAQEHCTRSLDLYRDLDASQGEAETLTNLGDVYRAEGDHAAALNHYRQALTISQELGLQRQTMEALLGLSVLYRHQMAIGKAIAYLQRASSIAQTLQSKPAQFRCHHALAENYREIGDFERALRHYERFHTIKEEVFNEEAERRLRAIELTHQIAASQRELELYRLKTVTLEQEINERKQAEAALQIAIEQLRAEIVTHKALIKELNAYAHTVAHDLKNPLTIVLGYSELLLDDVTAMEAESLIRMAKPLHRMTIRINRIIDELLLLASVRQEDINSRPLAMDDILADVEGRLADMNHTFELKITKPSTWPVALGHAPWIEEVWTNYLTNAIKYGGDPPQITIGATPQSDGMIEFWVRDNGQGIAQEAQKRLFTRFTQLDQRRATGHGLGLSIVKRIVEKLGGEVGVESDGIPGHGSTFSFTLPAAPME